MSFALAPLVALLRHLRLGHVPAVLLSLALALVILVGGGHLCRLAIRRPGRRSAPLSDQYRPQDPIHPRPDRSRHHRRLNQTIEALADQITGARDQQTQPVAVPPEEKPVPVEIRRANRGALGNGADYPGAAAGAARHPGAGAGVRRLHPAAEGRSARPLRAAGGIARHAAHHRGAGRSGVAAVALSGAADHHQCSASASSSASGCG